MYLRDPQRYVMLCRNRQNAGHLSGIPCRAPDKPTTGIRGTSDICPERSAHCAAGKQDRMHSPAFSAFTDIVEKPRPDATPSTRGVVGHHILTLAIFE